ncbi:MAG: TRM11 family SAM-dependent methyltransferase [Promethearchaeota archaeon]
MEKDQKPRYVFILGRDWRTSLLELDFFLTHAKVPGRVVDYSSTAAIAEFPEELPPRQEAYAVQHLGGTQKLARVLKFVPRDTWDAAFPETLSDPKSFQYARREITRLLGDALARFVFPRERVKSKKLFVANSIYPTFFDDDLYRDTVRFTLPFLNDTVVKQLRKKLGSKVTYYSYPRENVQSGSLNPIFPHHVIRYQLFDQHRGRAEIIYALTEEGCHVAHTRAVSDPNFFKEVDEQRPVKHFRTSIPPKLARVMLTFALGGQGNSTKKVLDPFCGTGTILMMVQYLGHSGYGSDASGEMTIATERNLKWFVEMFEDRKMKLKPGRIVRCRVEDLAQNFPPGVFDAIVTEPILLPTYREVPSTSDVAKEFENLVVPTYSAAFDNFARVLKPKGRIVIVAPLVKTRDGKRFQIDVAGIAGRAGFSPVHPFDPRRLAEKSDRRLQFNRERKKPSILVKGSNRLVGREIWILERIHLNRFIFKPGRTSIE